MLRVQLGYLTLNPGAHSHFCHSAYVTWSDVELWSAHMPARLLNFCCRTHFVRRDVVFICTKEQQRAVIRFLLAESVPGAEMHRRISVQYGNSVHQLLAYADHVIILGGSVHAVKENTSFSSCYYGD
jgi:hypothetical protein